MTGGDMVVQNGAVPPAIDSARDKTARQRWADLPRWRQAAILASSAAEIVLTTTALVDLVRRPRGEVRGPKTLWALGCAIQPFGPIAYLALGRRR
ncbi:MAG TPA: PLD nuclease N-terminal domain-containing protein [Actinoplanes sp.]|nr:PLD nuclease N-terminal domain-containing protein [Actinoplanes sp.]